MAWKYVQFNGETGKQRTVEGGGGGGGNVDDVLVNGTSVVDENHNAQIVSYKEVTQAEYNALPASKETDGVLYCIKDVGGADSFPPLIYSDEEREVGVWRDGKPLYEKVFQGTLTNPSTNTLIDLVDIASLNVDTVCNIDGTAHIYSSSFNRWLSMGINLIYQYNVSSKYICLVQSYSSQCTFDYKVILQYTKTTDTAGSGTWTTQGGYAHHYSTSEKVIGTWIDGKPLYERVVTDSRSGGFPSGEHEVFTGASTYHLIPDGLIGMMTKNDGTSQYLVPWASCGGSSTNSTSLNKNSSGKIILTVRNDNYASYYLEMVMRYTKSTD